MDFEKIWFDLTGSEAVITPELRMILLGVFSVILMILLFGMFQNNRKKGSSADFDDETDVEEDMEDVLLSERVDVPRKSSPQMKQTMKRSEADPRLTRAKAAAPRNSDVPKNSQANSDFIAISILAYDEDYFSGSDLLLAFVEEGLFYGDMRIFHRYYSHVNKSIIFSVASACEPGFFDLDSIDIYKTRGITLFMKFPFAEEPLQAYEEMLHTAQRIADKLGGELVDERFEMLTPETINRHRLSLSQREARAQA